MESKRVPDTSRIGLAFKALGLRGAYPVATPKEGELGLRTVVLAGGGVKKVGLYVGPKEA